jgi:nucleotide-binding universal stress UspA family protein
MLGIPAKATPFKRALLAYDGSERSKEALFVATYLAEMWKTELIVFTALEGTKIKPDIQDYVKRYLEIHEVQAEYIVTEQDAKATLKSTVDERQADLLLMGGYGRSLIREMVIGSTLDHMLRESNIPLFICR